MRCCLLDLRLSALLCAGFSLPGLAEQDGRSVLTYPALLETVLSAADAIGAGPLRRLCGDAAPSALLMKCLAGAARLACAEPACCAGGLSLGLVFYSCQSAGLPPVAGRWRAGCIRLGSFAALIVKAESTPHDCAVAFFEE